MCQVAVLLFLRLWFNMTLQVPFWPQLSEPYTYLLTSQALLNDLLDTKYEENTSGNKKEPRYSCLNIYLNIFS